MPIEEIVIQSKEDPIVMEEKYEQAALNESTTTIEAFKAETKLPIHVFVFVHGFQGSAFDMRKVKNAVSALLPSAVCLSASCNEKKTEGDIAVLGKNLAKEVTTFLTNLFAPSEKNKRS